jgi:hypothetical protein
MKIKDFYLILLLSLIVVFSGCREKEVKDFVGFIKFIKGKVDLIKSGKEEPAKVGVKFGLGDVIRTGKDGIVLASLGDDSAELEIQQNTVFNVDKYSPTKKKLNLKKGNLWMKVKKLKKNENISLVSPTSVAAVRGTKFFTFEIADIYGTCVCEGKVHVKTKDKKVKKQHNRDYLILTRGKKSIVLTPDDLKFMGKVDKDHEHSMVENSPVGPKAKYTPKQMKQFMKFINSKLEKAK